MRKAAGVRVGRRVPTVSRRFGSKRGVGVVGTSRRFGSKRGVGVVGTAQGPCEAEGVWTSPRTGPLWKLTLP
jgi:hypothetical protein